MKKRADSKGKKIPQMTTTPIPERELWLYRNPEALAAVDRGLADVAAGRVTELKDYSQYADLEIED